MTLSAFSEVSKLTALETFEADSEENPSEFTRYEAVKDRRPELLVIHLRRKTFGCRRKPILLIGGEGLVKKDP